MVESVTQAEERRTTVAFTAWYPQGHRTCAVCCALASTTRPLGGLHSSALPNSAYMIAYRWEESVIVRSDGSLGAAVWYLLATLNRHEHEQIAAMAEGLRDRGKKATLLGAQQAAVRRGSTQPPRTAPHHLQTLFKRLAPGQENCMGWFVARSAGRHPVAELAPPTPSTRS